MNGILKFLTAVSGLLCVGASSLASAAQGYSVEIDLSDQRAYLMHGGQVVLESPISSGRPGYATPTGRFTVVDKNIDHRSSLYGKIVDARGRTIVADADADMAVPPGARFVNAPMPYFVRFNGGIGMHAGYLPGYAASHGCVRLPEDAAMQFFSAVEAGTPVTVFGAAPVPRGRVVQQREERRFFPPDNRRREAREERVLFRPFRLRPWPWG
jgi:lipoprotein-anchoring transpeptidase ErfK/SrfK